MWGKIFGFVKKDDFLKAGAIVFIGSVFGNAMNYVYQVIMGRLMGPEDYGVFGALLGMLFVLQTTGGAFQKVISKYTAKYSAYSEYGRIKYLMVYSLGKFLLYGGIGLAAFLLFSPFISSFLKLESNLFVVLVGVLGYITLLGTILDGTLNGMQRFTVQSVLGIISGAAKLLFGITLVYLGFGVKGALWGLIISSIIGISIQFFPLRNIFKHKSIEIEKKEVYSYLWPVLFMSTVLILMTSVDVILVKRFFSSSMTGYYVAGSTIGKIILFGTGFLVIVMFPKISSLHAKKENTGKVLKSALLYTAIIAGAGVFVYYLIPNFIVNVMYGSLYFPTVKMLGLFGIAYALYSLNNVFVLYNMATERYNVGWFILVGLIMLILGIIMFHGNIIDVLKVVVVSNLAVFLLCLNYASKELFV